MPDTKHHSHSTPAGAESDLIPAANDFFSLPFFSFLYVFPIIIIIMIMIIIFIIIIIIIILRKKTPCGIQNYKKMFATTCGVHKPPKCTTQEDRLND